MSQSDLRAIKIKGAPDVIGIDIIENDFIRILIPITLGIDDGWTFFRDDYCRQFKGAKDAELDVKIDEESLVLVLKVVMNLSSKVDLNDLFSDEVELTGGNQPVVR